MTVEELAMIFYNDMLENGDDSYDPDSKFTKILNEIEAILEEHLDFKIVSKIEGLTLDLSSEDVRQHYVWGFCTGVEVARAVFNKEPSFILDISNY